jgi:hypothetical protein
MLISSNLPQQGADLLAWVITRGKVLRFGPYPRVFFIVTCVELKMSEKFDRKRRFELASVGIAIAAGTVLFFEILRSYLPGYLLTAITQSTGVTALAIAASLGLSMLFTGVGVIAVSGARLFVALRKADARRVHTLANDHLGAVLIVVLGFALSAGAMYLLSQVKP